MKSPTFVAKVGRWRLRARRFCLWFSKGGLVQTVSSVLRRIVCSG